MKIFDSVDKQHEHDDAKNVSSLATTVACDSTIDADSQGGKSSEDMIIFCEDESEACAPVFEVGIVEEHCSELSPMLRPSPNMKSLAAEISPPERSSNLDTAKQRNSGSVQMVDDMNQSLHPKQGRTHARSSMGSNQEIADQLKIKICEHISGLFSKEANVSHKGERMQGPKSVLQNIADDFTPRKGDQKILRAIGRTVAVNTAVVLTTATGGAAAASAVVGYVTGGGITAKRLFDGFMAQDEGEVAKSLAVYGSSTAASVVGQAAAVALLVGAAGVTLPLAAAVAFGVGCCSGITAGALSEWTVDMCMDDKAREKVLALSKAGCHCKTL